MRFFLVAITVLTLHLSFASHAQAGGIPIIYGTDESFELIEETKIPGPTDKPLSLCHYTSKYHLFYLGFWRNSLGYALTEGSCEGDSYYKITEEQFKEEQTNGTISADLPLKPKMSLKLIASGFAGLGAIALIVLYFAFSAIKKSRRKSARKAEMGDIPKAARQILDAMCHAAISDGSVDNSEIVKIAEIAEQMTGEIFGAERIQSIIANASSDPSEKELKAFGDGMGPEQRELVIKAIFAVISADGEITEDENNFFIGTAQALMMDGDTVRRVVEEVRGES